MDRTDGDLIRLNLPAAPTVWMATPDGLVVIDTIAVERAIKGDREGWTLTEDEARYAAELMFAHHVPYSVVADRVGRATETLRKWCPGQVEPSEPWRARGQGIARKPIEHGTNRGYQAHRRRGERACDSCRVANAEADRRYRLTGTSRAVGVAA